MQQEQKSFIEPTWNIGEMVIIGDRQYKILRYHPTKAKVQLEFITSDNEKVLEWKPTSELPPYPISEDSADTPPAPADEPAPVFEVGHKRASYSGIGPSLEVVGINKDGTYECEITLTGGKTSKTAKTAEELQKWGTALIDLDDDDETAAAKPMTSPAIDSLRIHQTVTDKELGGDEVSFNVGDARLSAIGVKLVVTDITTKGKYMCRIFAKTGTYVKEMTWQDIQLWGKAVEEKAPGYKFTDVAKAVMEKIETESAKAEAAKDDTQEVAVVTPVKRTEMKVESFVVRDAGGFDMTGATSKLNELLAMGWTLQNVEYQTCWMPDPLNAADGHVETVVYWTFSKVQLVS